MREKDYTLKPISLAIYVILIETTSFFLKIIKWVYYKLSGLFLRIYIVIRRYFCRMIIAFVAFYAGALYNDFYEHYRLYIFRTSGGDKRHQVPLPRKVQVEQNHHIYERKTIT